MNLTFTGGKELAAALRQLPAAIAQNVLEKSVVAGAEVVRASATMRCPRPTVRRRPGTLALADSIKITVTERARSFVTVNVGTKVKYAHLVEYGHQIVPRGPNRAGSESAAMGRRAARASRAVGARGFVTPKPFLRPAFDENREQMIQAIGDVMRVGIEAEAKKLGKVA